MSYKVVPNRYNNIKELFNMEINQFINNLFTKQEQFLRTLIYDIDNNIELTKSNNNIKCKSNYLTNIFMIEIIIATYRFLNSKNITVIKQCDGYCENAILRNTKPEYSGNISINYINKYDNNALEVSFYYVTTEQCVLITNKFIIELYRNILEQLVKHPKYKYNNLKIEGHDNTWYAFSEKEIFGKTYLLLENEEYGDETYHIIYNYTDNKVVTTGQGISWLDLQDKLIDEIINKIKE